MEISIEVESLNPSTEHWYPVILARFTMVATQDGKAVPVNGIDPLTDVEKKRFEDGKGMLSSSIDSNSI